jgi:HEAT repeat protein
MRRHAALVVLVCWSAGQAPVAAQKAKREAVVQGKAVSAWVKDLQGKDLLPRVQAINALMRAGPEARPAVPALLAVFGEKDASLLPPLAAAALSRVGPDAGPDLRKGLASKSAAERAGAALTLGLIGPPAAAAAGDLAGALKDDDAAVRQAAAQALGRLGPAARSAGPALEAALADRDAGARVEAAWALWRVRGEARGVAALTAALKEDNSALVQRSIAVLAEIGVKASAAAPALQTLLAGKEAPTRLAAAEVLARVTSSAAEALPVVRAEVAAKDKGDRRAAVSALGRLAGDEAAALLTDRDADLRREAAAALAEAGAPRPALERGLRDDDPGVRWWCALALASQPGDVRKLEEELLRALRLPPVPPGEDDPAARRVLDVQAPAAAAGPLVRVLKSRPARFQLEAARSLSRLGLDPRDSLPDLLDALRADDKQARRAVAEVVAGLGAEAQPHLVKLLSNPDAKAREAAARALGRMGVAARSARPALERVLKDPDAAVRSQAALALWAIDQDAEAALPVLTLVLKDLDTADRWEAVEAIGTIGAEARPAIRGIFEVLASALKDRDVRVRAQAARQLWRRERQAKVIVPLLRDVVTDRDLLARTMAVETLGELGAEERAFGPLTQALEDRDLGVRLLAEEALARGGADAVPRLVEALGAKSPRVRLGAVRALGLIGPAARPALGRLGKLASEGDAALQAAARDAVRAIGGANP